MKKYLPGFHKFVTGIVKEKWLIIIFLVLFLSGIGLYEYSEYYKYLHREMPTLKVTGEGRVDIPADKVVLFTSSYTTAADQQTAIDNDRAIIGKVKGVLASVGLSEKNLTKIETAAGENLNNGAGTIMGPIPTIATQPDRAYYSRTNYEITLYKDQVKKAEDVKSLFYTLLRVKTSEANPLLEQDVSVRYYALSDLKPYEFQFQEKAAADSRSKAENIARMNKASLGKVLSVEKLTDMEWQNDVYDKYYGDEMQGSSPVFKMKANYTVKYELVYPFFQL